MVKLRDQMSNRHIGRVHRPTALVVVQCRGTDGDGLVVLTQGEASIACCRARPVREVARRGTAADAGSPPQACTEGMSEVQHPIEQPAARQHMRGSVSGSSVIDACI